MPLDANTLSHLNILAQFLSQTRFDPSAVRQFELMSGGFFWTDERPPNKYFDNDHEYLMRKILGCRANIVLGKSDPSLQEIWDNLKQLIPDWHGFRDDRCSTNLAPELRESSAEAMKEFERTSEVCERAVRIGAMQAKKNQTP